jgi:flagella basal body P-ring formation protein FlgA
MIGERIRAGVVRGIVVGVAVACVMLVWAAGAAAGTVRLKGTALVAPGAPIALRDIADLEGNDEELGDVPIVKDSGAARGNGAWVVVEIDDVRAALADAGVSPGRVAVTGGRCVVRFVGAGITSDEKAKPKAEAKPVRRPEIVDTSGPATVRTRVVEMLDRMFGVEDDPGALRVLFDERDAELLGMEEWGRRVLVRPGTSGMGGRVLVEVRVFSGDQIIESRTIGVDVELRRKVVVLTGNVGRRDVITRGMVRETEMWVSPRGAGGPTSAGEVVGQRARKPLDAGAVLRVGDFEPAIVVARGSLVTVLCLKGGIGIQARGRAMDDGREGEMVECHLLDSRKAFEAKVDGPGRVVVVLD